MVLESYSQFSVNDLTCESSDNVVQNGFEVNQSKLKGFWDGEEKW